MEAVNQTWEISPEATPLAEETANTLTHGAGLVLSVGGFLQLFSATDGRGTSGQLAGLALFGASMVLLYVASTWYHSVQRASLKKHLRVFDHAAIYVLIAGTYTPFLVALGNPWGTLGLATIWLLAMAGVCFKVFCGLRYERLSLTMYLLIGWLGVLAMPALVERISAQGVAWLIAGGLAYTVGALFYIQRDVRYSHAIWHVFVVLGTALHYGAIVFYVVPLTFA